MPTTSTATTSAATSSTARTPSTADVERAVQHVRDGRLTRARAVLGELWVALADGPAWLRSAVAHGLAEAAPDRPTELAWRDRAVEQAAACVDRSMPFAGTGWTVGDMLPRLLLASAQAYARAGQPCAAMEDLGRAREQVSSMASGPGRTRLRRELAEATRVVHGGRASPVPAVTDGPGWVRLDPDPPDDGDWFDEWPSGS